VEGNPNLEEVRTQNNAYLHVVESWRNICSLGGENPQTSNWFSQATSRKVESEMSTLLA